MFRTFKSVTGQLELRSCSKECYIGRAAIQRYLDLDICKESLLRHRVVSVHAYVIDLDKLTSGLVRSWIRDLAEVIMSLEGFMKRNEFTLDMMDATEHFNNSLTAFSAAHVKLTNMSRIYDDL